MKIGVWNIAFLGDSILTLPLLQVLHATYPNAQVDFWVRSSYSSLYTEQEGYTTYSYTKGKFTELQALGKKIASMKYDVWINPHISYRSSYIMYCTKAKMRISYSTTLLNSLLSTHAITRDRTKHEVDRLFSLLEPLDISPQYTLPCYTINEAMREKYEDYCTQYSTMLTNKGTKKRIALAIGAVWKTKRWLPEHFASLTRMALDKDYEVCFVGGGKEEEALLEYVLECAKVSIYDERIHTLMGKGIPLTASLPLTAMLLANSTLCCGNDTGLIHLSWIQGIPTVALFGPTVPSQGFYPRSAHSTSLGVDLDCRPCGSHGGNTCKLQSHACMKELSPTTVWSTIESIIPAV